MFCGTLIDRCAEIGISLVVTCCLLNKGSLVGSATSLLLVLFSDIVFKEFRMLCGTITDGYPWPLIIVLKKLTSTVGFSWPSERTVDKVITAFINILISVSWTWFCNTVSAGGSGSMPLGPVEELTLL